jgi:hypothetical protein
MGEEIDRLNCRFHSAIRCPPECEGVRKTADGVFECGLYTLARKPMMEWLKSRKDVENG